MHPKRNLSLAVGLTDDHIRAIGLVAVRWAEIEHTMSEIIWDLVDMRLPSAHAITAHLGERTRANMCNALAQAVIGTRAPAKSLRVQLQHIIDTLYPERCKIVHSTWGASHEAGKSEILPINARGKLNMGPRLHYSADDISAIAEKIMDANTGLCAIRDEIRALLPKLPGQRRP